METDYKVKLDIFEGPLDLLLYLIKKNEFDIFDIPIAVVTEQYLEYIKLMKELNLDVAGEFLVMASTLMHIKSKMLLPSRGEEEDEEEQEDPRAELVRRLLEYQQYKEAASQLQERELLERDVFARKFAPEELKEQTETGTLIEVSTYDLVEAFRRILKEVPEGLVHEIALDKLSVAERIQQLLDRLASAESLTFESFFTDLSSKPEIIVTFLAILEMVRLRLIRAYQDKPYGTIRIYLDVSGEKLEKIKEKGVDIDEY
ncbi:MAG: segregation/condensation protein A [Deltaproteobacteria bacterium]|nr:MAG: segregation/condensation protein A [Deltaproteobacteria bacterium]